MTEHINSTLEINGKEHTTDYAVAAVSGVKETLLHQDNHIHEDDERVSEQDGGTSVCCSQRWIVAVMGLVFGVTLYILRTNISVALVSMSGSAKVNVTLSDVTIINITSFTSDILKQNISTTYTSSETCERFSLASDSGDDLVAEFDWDKTTQSLILSAFFYGYIVTQIPGGWIAGRYGGKHVIGISMAMATLLTILFPVCARTHVYLAVANKVIMGVFMGVTCPAFFAIVGVWALPHERSRFMAMFWFGTVLGTIIGYSTAGYLCVVGFDNGWGSVFYIHGCPGNGIALVTYNLALYILIMTDLIRNKSVGRGHFVFSNNLKRQLGICGIVFTICWYIFVFDSPEEHPRIQQKELKLLCKYLPPRTAEKPAVPLKHILTAVPVWSCFVAHTADAWLLYLLMSCLPLFMDDVLNFDIESNGVFSALPFFTMAIGVVVAGVLADYIMSRKWLSVTNTRKLFQTMGFVLSAVFILVCGYLTCDERIWVIVCLCLCTFFASLGSAGYPCNPVDIAPRFASVIFGISNTFSTIAGIMSPVVVSALTKNSTQEEWRHVFYLTAGIVLAANVVYLVGASSDLAPWAGHVSLELEVDGPVIKPRLRSSPLIKEKDNGYVHEQ